VRNYETIFVVHPDLREEYVQSVVAAASDLIRRTGGEILALNDWGNKKLNYQIQHLTRGRYFHVHYTAGPSTVSELERNLRISDRVFRYLSSRLVADVDEARVAEAGGQKLGVPEGIAPDFGSGGIEHLLRERPVEVPPEEEEAFGFGDRDDDRRGGRGDRDRDRGDRDRDRGRVAPLAEADVEIEGGEEDMAVDEEDGGKE
jgi:small subunit ribosomal protein S6